MKIKVFFTILFSLAVVMFINSLGSVVGDKLRLSAGESVFERAAGDGDSIPASQAELFELVESEEYSEKFQTANREVAEEYKWYFMASLVVQGLLIFGVVFGCSALVIRIVRRDLQC